MNFGRFKRSLVEEIDVCTYNYQELKKCLEEAIKEINKEIESAKGGQNV